MSNLNVELNDDVLRHIADYLTGRNALNFALVSKRLHDLAINRVVNVLIASSSDKLRVYHQFVLDDTHPRAHYVEGFEVDYMTFYHEEDTDAIRCVDNDDDYPFDERSVQLAIDLLEHTPNLRRLALHPRSDVLSRCGNFSKLTAVLTSDTLRRLQWVELNSLNDTILTLLPQTRWDLRVLSLRLQERWDDNDCFFYSTLVDILATFPRLHTFKICDFNIAEWNPSPALSQHTERRPFPSIRRLVLDNGDTAPALDLISRCPNVELLVFDLVQLNSTTKEDLKPPGSCPFPSWPMLHSLRADVHELRDTICADPLVDAGPVLHFQALTKVEAGGTRGFEDEGEDAMLLSLLKILSPVWAQLWVEVRSAPMRLWKDVPECAPRLRYLDLKISIPSLKEEYASWLDNIPDALGSLPLIYFGLHIQPIPGRSFLYDHATGMYSKDADGNYVWDVTAKRQVQFRTDCDTVALTLPEKCARAIPTLKFFALHHTLEQGRARSALTDERKDDVDVVKGTECDRPQGEVHEYALIGGSWANFYMQEVRLWRTARVGCGCRVQRLSARYRRRLQQCLEMLFDGGEPLDVILALYQESELAQ